jgi:integrase
MLTWEDVDFDSWRLRFKTRKNGDPRYIPWLRPANTLSSSSSAIRHETAASSTVPGTACLPSWICLGGLSGKRLGLIGEKHYRCYDLRHTTASYLTMNGATLAEVAEALGHRTLMMAKRYSHQSGEHVRGTLERMASRFLGDLGQETASSLPGRPETFESRFRSSAKTQ